jgi:PAS domain S-box-containing protein
MSTPPDNQTKSANPGFPDDHDASSLIRLLDLAQQSLGELSQTFLVIPGQDGESHVLGDEHLELSDICRERLTGAIEGADISIDPETGRSTIISDVLIVEEEGARIRWIATTLERGGALVACASEPWEPSEREHAILLGFAQIFDQHLAQDQRAQRSGGTDLGNLIVESARDGIVGIDADGRCRFINQTGARILGTDPDDVIGMPITELFELTDQGSTLDIHAIEDGQTSEYADVMLHCPDGTELPVDLTIVPSIESGGDVAGAVIQFADLREQKAAVAAVEQSEARHQAFLAMTLDSIVTIDGDGTILEFNLAAERTFRCASTDVVGKSITDTLVSPEWRDWWEVSFHSFADHGGGPLNSRRVQVTSQRADGSQFPADFTLTRIPTQNGWVYTLYIHDLTEEKGNERRRSTRYVVTHILAETESPMNALPEVLAAIGEGLNWYWGALWQRNPGSSQMQLELTWQREGVESQELAIASQGFRVDPATGFLGYIWTNRSADWIDEIGESDLYLRTEAAVSCGFRSLAAMPIIGRTEVIGILEFYSQSRREYDPEMIRMFDSLGSQIGQFIERKRIEEERVQILAREQSARTEAEAAERRLAFLAEASAQLSTSLEYEVTLSNVARLAVPRLADYCAIDMIDDDNQIRSLEIADIDPGKEEIGRRMHEEHPVDPDSNHPVAQVLRSGRPILFTDVDDEILRLFAENDDEYLQELRDIGIDSSMYVPLIARGRTIGVISFVTSESGHRYGPSDLALAQELTRRAAMAIDNARLYREAQEAVRIREEFLSIASHELKTPLTTVKGYSQILGRLLRRPTVDTSRLTRLADQLQDQLSRFETLIADLLDVSRIQQRGLELRPEPTDLVELTRMVISRFEYPAEPEQQHSFTIDAPEKLHGIWDPDRLDQVLTNLLSNAVKYSPDGGDIQISIGMQTDDYVELTVSDQGIGIPEEEQGQLFRPFARSETVQRAISGVGLGLYISQQIVTRHGGIIWVESKPGIGSSFVMHIPRDFNSVGEGSDNYEAADTPEQDAR